MTTSKKHTINGLAFDSAGPTIVSLDQLYTWVVWQFPRLRAGGFSGAVHPPIAGYGWYPAIIDPTKRRVLVYAHLEEPFRSPEAAAKQIEQAASSIPLNQKPD